MATTVPRLDRPADQPRMQATDATRIVASVFGVLAGLAGIEHGVGEMLQGSVQSTGFAIESWPQSAALEVLAGEPAITIIPNRS
jgi:hypothetical protein